MKKIVILIIVVACAIGGYIAYPYISLYFLGKGDNITLEEGEEKFIYIKTGSDLNDVADMLIEEDIIEDREEFIKLAQAKNYAGNNIVPGKYKIDGSMDNNTFINHLRAGNGRLTVNVTFDECRTLQDIAAKASTNIEATEEELLSYIEDPETMLKYGFENKDQWRTFFLPNTYEFYWDTDASEFVTKMAEAYKAFWNAERKQKAKDLGLSQSKVTTLASIVESEQRRHPEEWDMIAGLYLNRIKKNWKLESDPTLVYAIGDFSKRRVYNRDKEVDSPYNTYKNLGIPPGPIRIASPRAIDAVLNYKRHDYMFMCAKPGMGSYHNFAKTLSQHNANARKFHQWQNEQGIH